MNNISSEQASAFQRLVEEVFLHEMLPSATALENEVAYTGRVMYPIVRDFVYKRFNGTKTLVKGDGGIKKSTPVPMLDGLFRPDLSVEEGRTKVWAGEIKLVTLGELSGILAKAIGQGVIYSTMYLTSNIFLVVRNGSPEKVNQLLEINETVRLLVLGTKSENGANRQ